MRERNLLPQKKKKKKKNSVPQKWTVATDICRGICEGSSKVLSKACYRLTRRKELGRLLRRKYKGGKVKKIGDPIQTSGRGSNRGRSVHDGPEILDKVIPIHRGL